MMAGLNIIYQYKTIHLSDLAVRFSLEEIQMDFPLPLIHQLLPLGSECSMQQLCCQV
jgi:hypothetical protein